MNAGIFMIIIAGSVFARFVAMTGLATQLSQLISDAGMSRFLVFTCVVILYVICGCVMDVMSIIIITIPVIFPLLVGVGFDKYVVCIVLVFLSELGGITPPVGINVFAVASTLRVKAKTIFSGVRPFFIIDLVACYIFAFFPQISSFIPRLLGFN